MPTRTPISRKTLALGVGALVVAGVLLGRRGLSGRATGGGGCEGPDYRAENTGSTKQAAEGTPAVGLGSITSGVQGAMLVVQMFNSTTKYGRVSVSPAEILAKVTELKADLDALTVATSQIQDAVRATHLAVLNVPALDKVNSIRSLWEGYTTVLAKKNDADTQAYLAEIAKRRSTSGQLDWADLDSLNDLIVGKNGSGNLLSLTAQDEATKGMAASADDRLGRYYVNLRLLQEEALFLLSEVDKKNPAIDLDVKRAQHLARMDEQAVAFNAATNEYNALVLTEATKATNAQVTACKCNDSRTLLCESASVVNGVIGPDTANLSFIFDDPDGGGAGGAGTGLAACNAYRDEYLARKVADAKAAMIKTRWKDSVAFQKWVEMLGKNEDVIRVLSSGYGTAVQGSDAPFAGFACSGRKDCTFKVDKKAFGYAVEGIAGPFNMSYRCDDSIWSDPGGKFVTIDAEADGKTATISCPKLAGTAERVLGRFVNPLYNKDGGTKDPFLSVTITKVSRSIVKWTNDAGFGWTLELTPDASKLAVSKQCSYYQKGYTTAALKVDANDKVTGIMGPGNELYVAVPASPAKP
jgi:hypothetical protein